LFETTEKKNYVNSVKKCSKTKDDNVFEPFWTNDGNVSAKKKTSLFSYGTDCRQIRLFKLRQMLEACHDMKERQLFMKKDK